jgi:hypothetical protein
VQPLVRARTWLLSIGWRRGGRIGVTERPARPSARSMIALRAGPHGHTAAPKPHSCFRARFG